MHCATKKARKLGQVCNQEYGVDIETVRYWYFQRALCDEAVSAQLTSQRVHHFNRAIALPVRQVLGVENRGSAALGRMQDQGVPVRDLVPRFDLKRGDDRLRSVDDDLP